VTETQAEPAAPPTDEQRVPPGLRQLEDDLSAVAFVAGAEGAVEHDALLDRVRRLVRIKLLLEATRPEDAAPLIVIAGGTNVGKSTTFNWVVGEAVASSSPLARHTKAPTVYVHREALDALPAAALLPGYRCLQLDDPLGPTREQRDADGRAYFLHEHGDAAARDVVLIDSPDIDSTHDRNRAVAEDLLFLADSVVFVSTPEKYNDQLCVGYLEQAAALGKALTCVLNKGADEEVAADFREMVVGGLTGEATVLTLPYIPQPAPGDAGAFVGALREAVLRDPDRWAELRGQALAGARERVAADLTQVVSRLREELSELDRIRSEVDLALDRQRDAYERFLGELEFYELDRVFERVLEHFRIPVLDHVYDGVKSAMGFLSKNVSRLLTGGPGETSRQAKLRARAEADRQKVKELFESTRAEVLELPRRHAVVLHEAAAGWVRELEGASVEQLNGQVDAFLEEARAQADRWVEAEAQRHVELLEQHPYARAALRTVKGVFQVGFGLLSAKLTAGLGPWDLLIAPATERATKTILEAVGGYVHYQTIKSEFCRARAASFREAIDAAAAAPLAAGLPAGADPDVIDRLTGTGDLLRRGDV